MLKTRNEYLKVLFNNSIADINYLDIITEKLIEKAIFIYQKRKEYLDLINKEIRGKKRQELLRIIQKRNQERRREKRNQFFAKVINKIRNKF